MNDSIHPANEKKRLFFLFSALLIGSILRLSFPNDIEYKADEKVMFELSRSAGITQPWPMVGLPSGAGGYHPGLGSWIFIVLSRLTHASTPPELSRAVQLLNILGLFTLAFFTLRVLPEAERAPWYWATAFEAVNPIAILFQRKIWVPCLLPFFCVIVWIAWHYRKKRLGAFGWGLIGICLGQVHLSGFFLAAGIFIWTVIHDRQARWGSWLLGSLVGAVPLVPWLVLVVKPGNGFNWTGLFWVRKLKFWEFWLNDSLGMGLDYSLRKTAFSDFLRYPLVNGVGTYLVGLAHAAIIVTAVLIVVLAFLRVQKTKGYWGWIKDSSESAWMVHSALLVSGILMTLVVPDICRQYLIISYPLEWVWLSRLGLGDPRFGKKFLMVIWSAQLFISLSFLWYIHLNHGALLSDYGTAYQFQGQ